MSLIFTTIDAKTVTKSICGIVDDRVESREPKVGRVIETLTEDGGCTATLISPTCALSVGHCASILKYVEFNTPSNIKGHTVRSRDIDIYEVDQKTLKYADGGIGNDWAVFKLKPNAVTGDKAGDRQGYYDVTFDVPRFGASLVITGYGVDRDPNMSLAQQVAFGAMLGHDVTRPSVFKHNVDTMGGNSGSSVINRENGKVIGVHSHGGCEIGSNSGTLTGHTKFRKAIELCLNSER